MKKAALSFLLLLVCAIALHAQDVIVLRKGAEVKGKVIEIGEREIKYRKAENPEGPLYTLSKSEVFMIKYENGQKENFSNAETPAPAPENKEHFRKENERVERDPRHERAREPRERHEREPRRQTDFRTSAKKRITGGAVMTGIGLPCLIGGGTLMGIALDDMTGHSSNKYHIDDVPVLAAGIVLTAVGTVFTILGPVNLARGLRDKNMANATLDFKPICNPALDRYNYTLSRQTIGAIRITF